MKTQAIIAMAGSGTRMQAPLPKPLLTIQKKELFVYSVLALSASKHIDSLVLVVHPEYIDDYRQIIEREKLSKVKNVIEGGQTRQESVACGLRNIDDDTEIVAIHDGARPFIPTEVVDEAIEMCFTEKAVIVAVPVKSTIKRSEAKQNFVKETLSRDELWEVQTPQVFQKDILQKAHEKFQGQNASDDSLLVEKLGVKVKIVHGVYENIKITTQEDLIFAQGFIKVER